ncbi:MAG: tetratricopeptide repeat protein [Verrucomicrobiota bacterium]|jgi:Flp pilus assembly protein TadD
MNSSGNQNNAGWKSGLARALTNPVFICLLLAAVTLVVYWPVKNCDFVDYDDPDYFTSNPHVLNGLTAANVTWAFTTSHASNWHPLTWLSLMLDAELFGQGPAGPHLTNLLFHAANTVLLFLLFRCLTGAVWRSALVAALFALHPMHVESVAWVSERKDVLSTFFGLLSLGAWERYVEKSQVQNPKSKVFYGLALGCFALGLMSKPMLVTLPFVMLLMDWWPLERFKVQGSKFKVQSLVWEKIPFFVLSAVSCVVTFIVQQKSGAVAKLARFSASARIDNAFVSYARYLEKTFWLATLANPYPYVEHWPWAWVLFAVALFVGLCVAAIWLGRKFPFGFTGWFWFVGTLVPVIGLIQVGGQSMSDRYSYLPLIGLFIVLVWGGAEACARWHVPRRVVISGVMIVLIACAVRTRSQLNFWHDDETLFRHAMAVTKNNYIATVNLGTWFSKKGQIKDALDCYYLALQMNPSDASVLYDVGNGFAKFGKWDEAIANYRHALQVTPDQADILNNLGFALATKKQFADAIVCFEAALKLNPDYADAHNNLATVLFMEKRFEEAARHYREALRITPNNPQFYSNLGDALVRLGQVAEAVKCYQEALRLKPSDERIKTKLRALGAQISN